MQYKCERCYYIWQSRKETKPQVCPECKSPYWSKPSKKISKEFIEKIKLVMIGLHRSIIENSGGERGIRDEGGIYNAVYKVFNYMKKEFKHPAKVGAFVFDDLAKRHHFVDGNKRTAYCFTKAILIMMDYHLKVDYKMAVPFILQIANHKNPKTLKEIEEWIKDNIEKISTKNKIDKYLKELYYDAIYERKNGEQENDT